MTTQPPKRLFIDRDGTLITEPPDQQIDCIEKFALLPGVIPALLQLKQAGFQFIMISNQDGLGTSIYPHKKYEQIQNLLLNLLSSQGITFEEILICPHFRHDGCNCRKPKLGLVMHYLVQQTLNPRHSYVIGDRESDMEFAKNLNIPGIQLTQKMNWETITQLILKKPRTAAIHRKTNETDIHVKVTLQTDAPSIISTKIGFLNHMLEQLAKHGHFSLNLEATGDLEIDDHHTVEDIAITLGTALSQALSDKHGLARYGFVLPMDEALATIALDLSNRPFCMIDGFSFKGNFCRKTIGNFSTELVPHFFQSFAQALGATLHIQIKGENTHHMIEAIFKGVGRSLRQAIQKTDQSIPSTKGVL